MAAAFPVRHDIPPQASGTAPAFLARPFETPETRDAIERVYADLGCPHTLLRLGYGRPMMMTARRPAAEVMLRRSGALL